MRRGAHRSRSTTVDSGQIRLDFDLPTAAMAAAGTAVLEPPAAPAPAAAVAAPAVRTSRTARGRSPGRRSAAVPDAAAAPPSPRGGTVLFLDRRRSSAAPDTTERTPADWFELGCELEAAAPAEARAAYLRAIEADDRHAAAHLNLGRLLHETGDLRGAERHYRRALEVEPHPEAALRLGILLLDRGRVMEAEPFLVEARRLLPRDVNAWYRLSECYYRQGKYRETEAALVGALNLAPDDRQTQANLRDLRQLMQQPESRTP